MIVGANGVEPDPKKIKDLRELPIPSSPKLLQSFLGMVNYLSRFSPRYVYIWANSLEFINGKQIALSARVNFELREFTIVNLQMAQYFLAQFGGAIYDFYLVDIKAIHIPLITT